jgi:hypothetical protein
MLHVFRNPFDRRRQVFYGTTALFKTLGFVEVFKKTGRYGVDIHMFNNAPKQSIMRVL